MPEWSQQLRNDTRSILSLVNIDPFALNGAMGRCGVVLKNSDGRFGLVSLEACQTKCFQIVGIESQNTIDSYASIEDLLSGGWVVD